eukprot:359517-Chlamydomonas_euryale.AAC.19
MDDLTPGAAAAAAAASPLAMAASLGIGGGMSTSGSARPPSAAKPPSSADADPAARCNRDVWMAHAMPRRRTPAWPPSVASTCRVQKEKACMASFGRKHLPCPEGEGLRGLLRLQAPAEANKPKPPRRFQAPFPGRHKKHLLAS